MHKTLTLALILALAACSHDQTPPPIVNGTCLVDTYDGTTEAQQVCKYGAYSWSCRYQFNLGRHECTRMNEVGERPAVTK